MNSEYYSLLSLQEAISFTHKKIIPIKQLKIISSWPVEKVTKKYEISDVIWNKCYEKYKNKVVPFMGISYTIEKLLEQQYNVGIVTSRNKTDYIEFEESELGKYFSEIICFEDCDDYKPSPKPIKTYLNKYNKKAEETLYIGDSYSDLISSKKAGVDFGLALWNPNTHFLADADYHLKRPMDILKILGEL